MKDDSSKSLNQRIDELERRHRTLKWFSSGLALTFGITLLIGAARPALEQGDVADFKTIHAERISIRDRNQKERVVLELDQGEPRLTMFNHDGLQQVYLGINELWGDAGYLSVSSRLRDGAANKQAILIANEDNTQLMLCDLNPKQKQAARRHLVRLGTGNASQKPFMEIREQTKGRKLEVTRDMLKPDSTAAGLRFLLDTTPDQAAISGAKISKD